MQRGWIRSLALGLAAVAFLAGPLAASPVFTAPTTSAGISFAIPAVAVAPFLPATPVAVAHDGVRYYSASGAGPVSYQILDGLGGFVTNSATRLDFRSLFTDAGGTLFAREAGSSVIYRQSAPGILAPFVTLGGIAPDYQSSVVLNGAGTEYVAMYAGLVSRWALDGSFVGQVALAGFGVDGENDHPQRRALAAAGDYYLTYNSATRALSAWDAAGTRLDTTVLDGAGTGFAAGFSLSYANGLVFVAGDDGQWRGYDVGLGGRVPVPEPSSALIVGVALLGLQRLSRCGVRRAC